jgi:aryl-alcohol dehydrogenase-like predicted oxidoreductase
LPNRGGRRKKLVLAGAAKPSEEARGELPADEAIRCVLDNPYVTSLVVGGLSLDHFRANLAAAEHAAQRRN